MAVMPPVRPAALWSIVPIVPLLVAGAGLAMSWPRGVTLGLGGAAAAACTAALWGGLIMPARRAQRRRGDVTRALAQDTGTPIDDRDGADSLATLGRIHNRLAEQSVQLTTDLANARSVLEASPWPVIATSATGAVFLANHAAESFFQRAAGGLAGRSIEDLFTVAEVLTMHAEALAGSPRESQVRLPRPDGTRTYQVLAAPVSLHRRPQAAAETGVVLSLRDITELATAVQLKTDFVANASHELRTPVASIKAAVETLSEGAWEDGPMRGRFTQMIASNVRRLEEIIRDLLDLSRLESPEALISVESINLPALIGDVEDEMRPYAQQRSLGIEARVDPAAATIRADPRLLRLVLKNLVDNATKYAYEGTDIYIDVAVTPEGRGIRLRVRDKGIGIPINQQQRVFERFFQVDPARTGFQHRRGTGLGLAIVKHAVKAMGGTIGVESVWKQGTTMIVELPECITSSS